MKQRRGFLVFLTNMARSLHLAFWLDLVVLPGVALPMVVLQGCSDASCPDGAVRRGDRCIRPEACAAPAVSEESVWSMATRLDPDEAKAVRHVRLAVNPNGVVTAVWAQSNGKRYGVWSNRFVPNEGFKGAAALESEAAGDADEPRVEAGEDGSVVVVWRHYDGERWNLWANRMAPDANWSGPLLIETDNQGDVTPASVSVQPDGNATVVWSQYDGQRWTLRANRFLNGTGWSVVERIDQGQMGNATEPQVTTDGKAVLVVWTEQLVQSSGLRYNYYLPDQGWLGPKTLGTEGVFALHPRLVRDKENFMVVWSQGLRAGLYVQPEGFDSWDQGRLAEPTSQNVLVPEALRSDNRTTAFWVRKQDKSYELEGASATTQEGWGPVQTVNSSSSVIDGLKVAGGGQRMLAAWQATHNDYWAIFVSRHEADSWQRPERISAEGMTQAVFPDATADCAGGLMVAWQQTDDETSHVWASVRR